MEARADPLPEAVTELADSGELELAGERLRGHGEDLARSAPGKARRWIDSLRRLDLSDRLLASYRDWTVGAVLHLTGATHDAEAALEAAAGSMGRLNRHDLGDRIRLLLLDVYAEGHQLGRARRLAGRLERSFSERGDSERAAAALANLACAEDASDRILRARKLWRRALRRLEPEGLRALLVRANLANVAAVTGRFSEAEEGHREIAEQARERGLTSLSEQADLNLAETEFASGRLDAALDRWARVVEEARAHGNLVVELAAEVDLAGAEAEFGEIDRARRRLERVVPAARLAGLESEEVRALRLLAVLGAVDGAPGAWREVLPRLAGAALSGQRDLLLVEVAQLDPTVEPGDLMRAARRLEKAGLRQRAALGFAWAARRYADRGDARRAIAGARSVLSLRSASPWARMVAHHALGRADGGNAGRHYSAAVRCADHLHGRLAAAADRGAFLALRGEVYLDLVSLLLERGRAADRRRALDLLDRFRSGWLRDELARRADRGDDPQVHRWQELRRRLATILAEVEGRDEPRIRRAGLRLDDTLRGVERELGELERSLERRLPGVFPKRDGAGVADRLLRLLPAKHLLLDFFLDEGDLLAFMAFDGRLEARRHRGLAGTLRELVASVRFHLDTRSLVGAEQARLMAPSLAARIDRLGEILLGDLPSEGWEAVWIVPHGMLYQLPWPALPCSDGRPLIDRAKIGLVPGPGAAAELLESEARRPRSAAIGGAPAEGLPQVDREIRSLARIMPQATVVESADRERFLRMLESHDLVHLAGHALFLEALPKASGLRLSNGFVTVHDLVATRIQAVLVSFGVCSGVRVATGQPHRYDGFLRSLLAGGVRSVVGASSPVRDEVAHDFDLAFHRRLAESGDPGDAYVEAVRTVRAGNPDPATWGSFQLYGDLRPWGDT